LRVWYLFDIAKKSVGKTNLFLRVRNLVSKIGGVLLFLVIFIFKNKNLEKGIIPLPTCVNSNVPQKILARFALIKCAMVAFAEENVVRAKKVVLLSRIHQTDRLIRKSGASLKFRQYTQLETFLSLSSFHYSLKKFHYRFTLFALIFVEGAKQTTFIPPGRKKEELVKPA